MLTQTSNNSTGFGFVEPYQQIEKYSCGAATLKAVMQHWDEYADERDLIREVGVDPETGSTCYQVESAARKRGYWAQTRTFRTIDDLAAYTDRDVPVILAIQSFTRPGQGHFVVATDIESDLVQIMDPNVRGNRRTLSRAELDERWKFRDRVGVVVMPPAKRQQFGAALPAPSSKRTVAIAIIGAIVALAAAGAGVVIYRRRKR